MSVAKSVIWWPFKWKGIILKWKVWPVVLRNSETPMESILVSFLRISNIFLSLLIRYFIVYLERGAEVELLRVLAEEGPGRVQLDEVDVVAALLRHLLQHIQIFLQASKYFYRHPNIL